MNMDFLNQATEDLLATMDGATGGEWESPFSSYPLPEKLGESK